MGKILIASRWYKPEKNPRAFRTYELVEELLKRGNIITTFLPEDAQVASRVNNMTVPHGEMKKSVLRRKKSSFGGLRSAFVYFIGEGPTMVR